MLPPTAIHNGVLIPRLAEKAADFGPPKIEDIGRALDHGIANQAGPDPYRQSPQMGEDRAIDPIVVTLRQRADRAGQSEGRIEPRQRVRARGQRAPRELDELVCLPPELEPSRLRAEGSAVEALGDLGHIQLRLLAK